MNESKRLEHLVNCCVAHRKSVKRRRKEAYQSRLDKMKIAKSEKEKNPAN